MVALAGKKGGESSKFDDGDGVTSSSSASSSLGGRLCVARLSSAEEECEACGGMILRSSAMSCFLCIVVVFKLLLIAAIHPPFGWWCVPLLPFLMGGVRLCPAVWVSTWPRQSSDMELVDCEGCTRLPTQTGAAPWAQFGGG